MALENRAPFLLRTVATPKGAYLLALFCMSWINPAFALLDETPPMPDIEVLHADFGLFNRALSGELVLTPSAVVPLKKGQQYGWSILLRTSKPRVRWH
ncbi:MAG: hypothetical protein WCA45_02735 [Thiobacillaceae bacterium]